MKCPKCKSRRIEVTGSAKGFTANPVKECEECGAVWVNAGNHVNQFIFTTNESQQVTAI